MADTHEIELKLELDPADLERVSRRIAAVAGTPRDVARRLKATYFDTADRALRRRGLSLRIREDGANIRQTLKSERDGLFDRRQWESATKADRPDARLFRKKPRKLIGARDFERVFTTDVRRTTWHLDHHGSRIEIVLDEGEVRAGMNAGSLAEVELELMTGARADLFEVAHLLAEDMALRVGVRSKSDRGYALTEPVGKAVKAEEIELDATCCAAVAFQVVARSCLRQFRLNEAALIATRHPDALHQARVAIRRLRSALSIFRKVVADDRIDAIKHGLKDLAATLGAARNLDVYRTGVVAPRMHGDEAAPHADHTRIDTARDAAYARVFALLESQAFRLFVLDLAAWIETGPWLANPIGVGSRTRRIDKFASAEIQRRTRSVLKKGRDLAAIDAGALHRVRIVAKKLRYASEFFASLIPGERAQRRHRALIRRLEALQDALGAVNDIHTGRDVAKDIVVVAPATGREASDLAMAQAARERELVVAAAEAFAKFRHAAA